MTSRRLLKAAEAIREVVAASILTELRDPRVQDVTVVGVKVSPDMREAQIAVSIMGDESQQQLSLRGLQNAAGFLQSRIASRIEARYTPRLQFVIDKGIQHSLLVGEILEQIKRENDDPEQGELADQNMTESESSDSEEVNPNTVDQDGLPESKVSTEARESQPEPTDPSAP
ncbi:MAG: 30S ribosome-binding factor RbfA [Rubripirellula sp.]